MPLSLLSQLLYPIPLWPSMKIHYRLSWTCSWIFINLKRKHYIKYFSFLEGLNKYKKWEQKNEIKRLLWGCNEHPPKKKKNISENETKHKLQKNGWILKNDTSNPAFYCVFLWVKWSSLKPPELASWLIQQHSTTEIKTNFMIVVQIIKSLAVFSQNESSFIFWGV